MNWGQLSRAGRDASYNNSAAVAGSADYMAKRVQESAAFRKARAEKLDLPYGPRERNACDLFPGNDPAAPCLVFIHGGYWQRNSRDGCSVLAEGILSHGWSAAFPGYTLAPDASLTQIVAEIHAALDWLATEGRQHGISGKIIVTGWSAGGHLTAMALSHPSVAAALAISGVYELGPIRDTYLNEKLNLTDDEIVRLSPLRLPVVHKPMGIAYGTRELPPLVNDSRDLHALRAAVHAPGPLLPIAGADHFSILDTLRDPRGEITRQLLLMA